MVSEEDKNTLNLLKQFAGLSKKNKIEDYDTALLNNFFENITGTPREKYDQYCDRLILVAARIERYYKDHDDESRPEILSNISIFLNKPLPSIAPEIEDYTQREGRVITIKRGDKDVKCSCITETFNKTIDRISEEQYYEMVNEVRELLYLAIAELKENIIPWHKEGILVEVDPNL